MQKSNIMPALTLQSWFVLKYLPVVVEGENLLLFSLFDKTPPPPLLLDSQTTKCTRFR